MHRLIESKSIPYEATPLRGERLLVLAPHPDDEVIGCGGLVAQHLREGRSVRILVATDGAEAGNAARREEESRRAVARLGDATIEFLRFPDRALDDRAAPLIRQHLADFRPDLILVPGPIEIHPDHLALAQIFCGVVQADEILFADLALARVAFYEIGQPLRPNVLVDITDVAEEKYAAIAEHVSQGEIRDYTSYARGLNAYRTMTLPPGAKYAEGYYVVDLSALRTTPFSALRRAAGTPPEIEVTHEPVPVSVIIRTKDRPRLLAEAVESVRATRYPCEIIVVNDGGAKPSLEGVTLVEHETSRGRAEAANAGARAAKNTFLSFLDDDDIFHPEHFEVLTKAVRSPHVAWYSDAVSVFLQPSNDGSDEYEETSRLRLYAHDYDRELLLLDNYIPLPTLLLRRQDFLDLGGFDSAFDLFEDWDFLIRLSERGDLLHIPRITCDVRHFQGGSSVVLAAPEGSARFRAAKLQVWNKHAERITKDLIASVLERQKRRTNDLYSSAVELRGLRHHADVGAAAADRQRLEMQHTINGLMLRVRELEGETEVLRPLASQLAETSALKSAEIERLTRAFSDAQTAARTADDEIARLRVEIERLNGLLELIYRSRTWKLHNTVEKLRGRR